MKNNPETKKKPGLGICGIRVHADVVADGFLIIMDTSSKLLEH